MLIILICAVGLAIIFAIDFWSFEDSVTAKLGFTSVGVFFGGTIGLLLAAIVGIPAPEVTVKTEEISLAAFNDSRTIRGSFFLGCGTVEGNVTYFYYRQRPDGGLEQGWVQSENVIIYEEDRADGILQVYQKKLVHPWEFWALPWGSPCYQFRVPKGTVIRQFKADLQ